MREIFQIVRKSGYELADVDVVFFLNFFVKIPSIPFLRALNHVKHEAAQQEEEQVESEKSEPIPE